jgi:PAS domain S-box-containing protein
MESARLAKKEELDLLPESLVALLADRLRKLRDNEIRMQTVWDTIPDCVKTLSLDGRLQHINAAGLRLMEAETREDALNTSVISLIHADDRPRVADVLHRVAQGETCQIRFRMTGLKGTPRWMEMTAVPLRDEDGHITAVLSICRDVSDQVRSEASLRQTLKLLLNAERIGNMGSWSMDLLTNRLEWSEETCRLFGIRKEDFSGTFEDFYARVLPEDRPKLSETIQRSDAIGGLLEVEYRIRRPDGTIRWMHERGDVERDDAGRPIRRLGMVMDITERKLAEEALRASEERFRLLSRATNDALWDWDLITNELTWNDGYTTIFGYAGDEVPRVGGACVRLIHPEDRERVWGSLCATIQQGGHSWNGEYRFLRKDGKYAYVVNRAHILRDNQGRAVHVVGGITDLTERKNLEEQLLHSQKLEAIGRLAGGVAHDFNNLLTVISGYTEVLLNMTPADDAKRSLLTDIQRAAERAASLTRQLLAFSRKQLLMPQVLDLNATIAGIESLIKRLVGEDVVLSLALAPNLDAVRVDAGQLEQAILNLAVNARDAMPHGGRLTISTGAIDLAEDNRYHAPPGRYLTLTIADTGSGIPAAIRDRIFEPFFTTKGPGRGTGLGLPMVFGFVKQSGGFIDFVSEEGQGTQFTITLPAAPPDEIHQRALPNDAVVKGGNETILLVEDEDDVRRISQLTLEAQGYCVLSARDGVEALRVFADSPSPIQLVVTDVVMPNMNGRQLVKHLRQQVPHLKVLFVSGYTDDQLSRHGLAEARGAFLAKPFLPLDLARKVREVLDETDVPAGGVPYRVD